MARGLIFNFTSRSVLLTLVVGLSGALVQTAAADRLLLLTIDGVPGAPGLDAKGNLALATRFAASLKKAQAPALIFAVGSRLRSNDGALRKFTDIGIEVGSLGQAARDLGLTELDAWLGDFESGRSSLTDVLATLKAKQRTVRYFRFPGLSEGIVPEHQIAAKNAMAAAGGRHVDATVDLIDGGLDAAFRAQLGKSKREQDKRVLAELSQDWLAAMRALIGRSEKVGDRVAGEDSPQVLRLTFDTITADNLDALLGWLIRQGYRLAPATEVLGHPIFSRPHSYTGRRGVSLYWRVRISDDLRRAEKEVNDLLFKAGESWSRGDLDGFMAAFTEDARIVSGRQLVEGRQTIRAKYRERYPTAGSMGRLAIELSRFDIHTTDRETLYGLIEPIPPRFATATAKWTLIPKRGMGRTGYASLALQKTNAGWRILEDHSSTGSFIRTAKGSKKGN